MKEKKNELIRAMVFFALAVVFYQLIITCGTIAGIVPLGVFLVLQVVFVIIAIRATKVFLSMKRNKQ